MATVWNLSVGIICLKALIMRKEMQVNFFTKHVTCSLLDFSFYSMICYFCELSSIGYESSCSDKAGDTIVHQQVAQVST